MSGDDRVDNYGTINGDISLSYGDDVYVGIDGAHGSGLVNGTIFGGHGEDTISSGAFAEVIDGGVGNNVITGSNGKDLIYGDAGNDTLSGGNDYGTPDADTLYGGSGDDVLISDQTVVTNSKRQHLGHRLYGEEDNDSLYGGLADDHLDGGTGDDLLEASGGTDILIGESGSDTLTGGAGADSFVYKTSDAGSDTITDFDLVEDAIDLSALLKGYTAGVSDLNDWVSISANIDGSTRITIDHDGDGAGPLVTIDLEGIAFATLNTDTFLQEMIL